MLCITMKRGEYFTVGGNTVVLFDQMSSERVHVTIQAPREVPIVRSAVLERNGTPTPPYIEKLRSRAKAKYKPEAAFRWNDDREQAVRMIQKVADSLEQGGAVSMAETLKTQLDRIVPKVWEEDIAAR